MKKIAWIGTGVMGRPMAEHIRRAGYEVVVYNRSPEKALAMAPFVKVASSISECVKDADVIFSIVGYPSDVRAVYDTVFTCAKPGALCVDMTTSSPALAKSLYQEAKRKGLRMVDSPVTGGDIGAINATLSIMVGGDESDYLEILPLLEVMGKRLLIWVPPATVNTQNSPIKSSSPATSPASPKHSSTPKPKGWIPIACWRS
ncbi:MAG: NAD(P)-binding domain-containing protein [Bacillus subtilis]|nr:NAD(P)-binding domain-containing protein [Bacillus subtilis]